jgi:hypothetical protein
LYGLKIEDRRPKTERITTYEKVNRVSAYKIFHSVLFLKTAQKNDNILSI